MAVSETRMKRTRLQIAVAAVLVASACAPLPHRTGAAGGDSQTMIRIGDTARDAGEPRVALPHYQRAHRLDPENTEAVIRIAETFNQIGAHREAGDAWISILRLQPRNFAALVGYGHTMTALEQPLIALEYFDRAEQFGENAAMLNGMGVAHDMLGNAAQAKDAYRRGLALAPDSLRLSNNLGLSLALSGDSAAAIKLLEEVAAMPGATIRHRQNLALAYALGGFPERARTIGRRDLDELSVQRNLTFYRLVADFRDHAEKVAAVGAHNNTGGVGSDAVPVQNAKSLR